VTSTTTEDAQTTSDTTTTSNLTTTDIQTTEIGINIVSYAVLYNGFR
jgi:hypothetical protein